MHEVSHPSIKDDWPVHEAITYWSKSSILEKVSTLTHPLLLHPHSSNSARESSHNIKQTVLQKWIQVFPSGSTFPISRLKT